MDYLFITGKTDREHLSNLRALFERLRKYGVRVKLAEGAFMQDTLEYLGHDLRAAGILPIRRKCHAIAAMPTPQNLEQLV